MHMFLLMVPIASGASIMIISNAVRKIERDRQHHIARMRQGSGSDSKPRSFS